MRVKDSVLSQLSDFRAWSETGATAERISLLDYVGFVAKADTLFAFAELFFPETIVHEGLHFLASGFSTETYLAWVQQGKRPEEIQRVLNHVHISTLLQDQEISDEAALEAARAIAQVWNRTLGPDGMVAEAIGETFEDAAVTLHERTQLLRQ
jgi:hypothetical protein